MPDRLRRLGRVGGCGCRLGPDRLAGMAGGRWRRLVRLGANANGPPVRAGRGRVVQG